MRMSQKMSKADRQVQKAMDRASWDAIDWDRLEQDRRQALADDLAWIARGRMSMRASGKKRSVK